MAVAVSPLFVPPANVPLAPVEGAVNVTVAPSMGRLWLSSTVAWRLIGNAVLIVTLCPDPAVTVIEAGGALRFVREKFAGPIAPALAATVYGPPGVLLAVNVGAVATPLAPVVTVAEEALPVKDPLAPLAAAVAVNVTETPLTPFPPLSVTVA
jgi:hypothetical protein